MARLGNGVDADRIWKGVAAGATLRSIMKEFLDLSISDELCLNEINMNFY